MKQYGEPLNEAPMVFSGEVNPLYVDRKLIAPIKHAVKLKLFKRTSQSDIYSYAHSSTESIYVIYNKEEDIIVGATSVSTVKMCGENYVQINLIKKLANNHNGVVLKLYKAVANDYKMKLLSDDSQSATMKRLWMNWTSTPTVYGFSNSGASNRSTCERIAISQEIWGEVKFFKKYLIWLEP